MAVKKKSVKNLQALKTESLQKGARINDSGSQFNTNKTVAEKKRLQPAYLRSDLPEKPEPPPPEPKADPGSVLVAERIDKMAAQHAGIMEDLRAQIASIKIEVDGRPLAWEFDFIRDEKTGYLKKIKATAGSAGVLH